MKFCNSLFLVLLLLLSGSLFCSPHDFSGNSPLPPLTLDLGVTGITGVYYVQHNTPLITTVAVQNFSPQTVTEYDVVLLNGESELARIAGVQLAPDATHDFTFTATIDTSGLKTIVGRVELPNDENAANNQRTFACIVCPDPATATVFGSGNQLLRLPIDLYWKYSLYEALYYPEDIGSEGLIYGISFFLHSTFNHSPDVQLWIGETAAPDLSSGWIPATQLTQVWDSGMYFPQGNGEIYIPFSQPYHYQGQNLVLMVYHSVTYLLTTTDPFEAQILPGLRALMRASDAYNPDPNNPPANITPSGEVPKTAFYMVPTVANEDEHLPVAESFSNHPNPFRQQTTFSFPASKAPAIVEIFNLKGQKVRSLSGTELSWDGVDNDGKTVPVGVYFARLEQSGRVQVIKLCKVD